MYDNFEVQDAPFQELIEDSCSNHFSWSKLIVTLMFLIIITILLLNVFLVRELFNQILNGFFLAIEQVCFFDSLFYQLAQIERPFV